MLHDTVDPAVRADTVQHLLELRYRRQGEVFPDLQDFLHPWVCCLLCELRQRRLGDAGDEQAFGLQPWLQLCQAVGIIQSGDLLSSGELLIIECIIVFDYGSAQVLIDQYSVIIDPLRVPVDPLLTLQSIGRIMGVQVSADRPLRLDVLFVVLHIQVPFFHVVHRIVPGSLTVLVSRLARF